MHAVDSLLKICEKSNIKQPGVAKEKCKSSPKVIKYLQTCLIKRTSVEPRRRLRELQDHRNG